MGTLSSHSCNTWPMLHNKLSLSQHIGQSLFTRRSGFLRQHLEKGGAEGWASFFKNWKKGKKKREEHISRSHLFCFFDNNQSRTHINTADTLVNTNCPTTHGKYSPNCHEERKYFPNFIIRTLSQGKTGVMYPNLKKEVWFDPQCSMSA